MVAVDSPFVNNEYICHSGFFFFNLQTLCLITINRIDHRPSDHRIRNKLSNTVVIASDSDMPKCLNSTSKQSKMAKKLAAACLGSPAVRVENPDIQGFFSRTMCLTLKDGRQIVVQFRLEDLDLTSFRDAREALGPVVPEIGTLEESEELKEAGVRAYWMTRCPGKLWYRGIAGKGVAGRVAVCQSLGAVLSRGFVANDSASVAQDKVLPHVDALLASDEPAIAPFKSRIQELRAVAGQIGHLPLW